MAEESERIDKARQHYLQRLVGLLSDRFLPLLMDGKPNIEYKHSCAGESLEQILLEERMSDIKKGFTASGPHRAEIIFSCAGVGVARHLSRGQVKLYGAALVSSQLAILKQTGSDAIVLVDDIDAELDSDASKRVLGLLASNQSQTFVSSLELPAWMPELANEHAVFHVKQGRVEIAQ